MVRRRRAVSCRPAGELAMLPMDRECIHVNHGLGRVVFGQLAGLASLPAMGAMQRKPTALSRFALRRGRSHVCCDTTSAVRLAEAGVTCNSYGYYQSAPSPVGFPYGSWRGRTGNPTVLNTQASPNATGGRAPLFQTISDYRMRSYNRHKDTALR